MEIMGGRTDTRFRNQHKGQPLGMSMVGAGEGQRMAGGH